MALLIPIMGTPLYSPVCLVLLTNAWVLSKLVRNQLCHCHDVVLLMTGGHKRAKPEHDSEAPGVTNGEAATGVSSEQPAKLIKLEDGSAAPPTATPADSAAASAPPSRSSTPGLEQKQRGGTASSDEFVLTADMENILVNFLVRMAFLIGESQDKDPDMQALHQHTLKLLSQALTLFLTYR
eukprot:GHUV01041719.1.p1 GENE.GHUV01041719.1~~GHUV01041719.1.p1  ORF type:complete len:181 (-),score=52.61 GHUV01041719.1:38-580(-)